MHRLIEGDCRAVLPTLSPGTFDAIVCDPPYPCIERSYGTWTVDEWFALMDVVVPQCRRVLKPHGSAVFVLQPNSERVGRMRTWLWDFLAKWGREWGVVQDAYWWNTSAMTLGGSCKDGLLRPSLKTCVWLGPPDCWRDESAVLLPESASNRRDRESSNYDDVDAPSRRTAAGRPRDDMRRMRSAAARRGGVAPFNVLPIGSSSPTSGGTHGHPASTPLALMRWWVRYLVPPGGVALDPFAGSGTLSVACACEGRDSVLIEQRPEYCAIVRRRLAELRGPLFAQED